MTSNIIKITFEHLVNQKQRRPTKKKTAALPFQLRVLRFAFNTLGRIFPDKASQYALQLFSTPRFRARHKVSDTLIDEATVSDVLVSGINIKLYEWGEGDKIILMVHGWESRGTALRAYIPDLLKAGYKIITFDAPAHGDSDGKQANLLNFAEAIKTLVKQSRSIHGLIAHSFGGPASIYALSQMPDGVSIPKIVMLACPSAISVPVYEAINIMKVPPGAAGKFIKKIEKIVQLPIEKITTPHFANAVNIKKMLIIHDINDTIVPIESAIVHFKAFTQSKLLTTEGLGHHFILKDKQVINRVVDFFI